MPCIIGRLASRLQVSKDGTSTAPPLASGKAIASPRRWCPAPAPCRAASRSCRRSAPAPRYAAIQLLSRVADLGSFSASQLRAIFILWIDRTINFERAGRSPSLDGAASGVNVVGLTPGFTSVGSFGRDVRGPDTDDTNTLSIF